MLPSSSCTCVLLRKLWTLPYVTWRILHSDTFSTIYSVPLFCYIIHNIAIRFRHWSSRATPGTPASSSSSSNNNNNNNNKGMLQFWGTEMWLKKEAEKILKYKDLTREVLVQRMWTVKTKVIPVIIGATGSISKSFRKYVSNIPGNHEVKELQKTTILGTAHTL